MRQRSTRRGSTFRTASVVTIRIGHTQANATMLISSGAPNPKIASATGMKATAGTGRSAASVGPTILCKSRDRPKTMPTTTPITAANSSPPKTACSVCAVASDERAVGEPEGHRDRNIELGSRPFDREQAQQAADLPQQQRSRRDQRCRARSHSSRIALQQLDQAIAMAEKFARGAGRKLIARTRQHHGKHLCDRAGIVCRTMTPSPR